MNLMCDCGSVRYFESASGHISCEHCFEPCKVSHDRAIRRDFIHNSNPCRDIPMTPHEQNSLNNSTFTVQRPKKPSILDHML